MKKLTFKLGLRTKLVLLVFTSTSILLASVNVFWFYNGSRSIRSSDEATLASVTKRAAQATTSFFDTKRQTLIIHSQSDPILQHNLPKAEQELTSLLIQEQDVQQLALISQTGKRELLLDRSGNVDKSVVDLSSDPAFRATTFVGGAIYNSSVRYTNGKPEIDIAVPIIPPDLSAGSLNSLSTSSIGQYRSVNEIKGVLKATISLSPLWSQLADAKAAEHGYVFVVDDTGQPIFHPNLSYIKDPAAVTSLPEVKKVLAENTGSSQTDSVSQANNEAGAPSVFFSTVVPNLRWGVVGEMPLSDISAATGRDFLLATLLSAAGMLIALVFSLLVARSLIGPLRRLQEGTRRIGEGDFSYKLDIRTGDEVQELGDTFNAMAGQLQQTYQGMLDRQARLESSINSLNAGLILTDLNLSPILVNHAAREIYKALTPKSAAAEGIRISELDASFSNTQLMRRMTQSLNSSKPESLRDIDARGRIFNIFIAPVMELDHAIGILLVIDDVTEARVLERSKEEFFSIASHELRTPLTVIKGNASLIQEYYLKQIKNDDLRQMIVEIYDQSTGLIQIVNDFLDTSRIDQHRIQYIFENLDLAGLVKETVKDLTSMAKEKKLKLNLDVADNLLRVRGDRNRTRQVLVNLLGNALKFTTEGSITTSVKQVGSNLEVQVTDTGSGIPLENQKLLFRKFQQANTNPLTRDISHGTGLGLYISRSLIEGMGGTIRMVKSDQNGTTFAFTLPVVPNTLPPSVAPNPTKAV